MDSCSLEISILLICRDGKSRQMFQSEIDFPEVTLITVQSLTDFFTPQTYCPLNGILVDMPTYLRSSEEDKNLLTDLVDILPSLRLKCHEPSGEIRTLPFGTAYPGSTTLSDFVQKYCMTIAQRKIRTSERTQIHLPALLDKYFSIKDISHNRTVTTNVSHEGCFLVSFEPWTIGEQGWLFFQELKDTTPIPVEVCWVKSWGKDCSLPGMGVRFIKTTESQKSELLRLGGKSLISDSKKP